MMPKLHESRFLPYSHKQLFDLVMDVESYPKFLPFCADSRILSRNGSVITAELTIKASLFKESYTSLITPNFTEDEATIYVVAITGPFKHLANSWKFKAAEEGAIVDFTLDFDLKSLLLGRMMGGYLSEAYTKMINAFEKRAQEIYDKEKDAP